MYVCMAPACMVSTMAEALQHQRHSQRGRKSWTYSANGNMTRSLHDLCTTTAAAGQVSQPPQPLNPFPKLLHLLR
jgi:hypothetical protein